MADLTDFIERVRDWHRDAFPVPDRALTALKSLEEAAEMHAAVHLEFLDPAIMEEACDVIIVGFAMAIQLAQASEIEVALNKKLGILKSRSKEQQRRNHERSIRR